MVRPPTRRDVLRWTAGAAVGTVVGGRVVVGAGPQTATTGPAVPPLPPMHHGRLPVVVDVSDVVRTARGKDRTPGLWGAVVTTRGLDAVGAAGVRKWRTDVAATPQDQVHLGSCTKAMTATLVGQLVRTGKLAFDRPLSACFPTLAAKANPAMAAVTVRQLLDHRGGLPADVDWSTFDAGPGPVTAKRLAVVEHVLGEPPATPPGNAFAYSNTGYLVLGAIVEAVQGRPWETVIQTDLFAPLGMAAAGFGPPGTPGQVDQPWGHLQRLAMWVPVQSDNPEVFGPAGRVHCSMADWAKYVAFVLRADAGDTPVLDRATQAALLTPSAGDYAAGWSITDRPWAGGRTLVHSGDNTTNHCVAWLAPKKGFAVLAAANVSDDAVAQVCDDLASGLIRWHLAR